MLELPGITTSGDAELDVQKVLRYLSKLVPQLEMELADARQDGYLEQYNAVTQGVGAVNDKTTAGALVAHELRKDNPHGVTAEQLGLKLGKLIQVTLANNGLMIRIGEARGLQINVQDVQVQVESWTKHGGVSYADNISLGKWENKIPVLYYTGVTVLGGTYRDYWAGPVNGSDSENIGNIRMYHEYVSVDPAPAPPGGDDEEEEEPINPYVEDIRDIKMTVIGMGVYGYGE